MRMNNDFAFLLFQCIYHTYVSYLAFNQHFISNVCFVLLWHYNKGRQIEIYETEGMKG